MTAFDRLKELCDAQGMSVNKLEEKLELSKNTLYSWKKNTPKGTNLIRVADYFKVSTDYLLGRTDEPHLASSDAPEWATTKDKRDLEKYLADPQGLFYKGIEFSEEDRAKMLGMLEAMFWEAKRQNKEVYKKSRQKNIKE
ncbi:helix-turn-helix domain-containing protein [Paenibacillus senegalensis]|uniref:helix-turn-helix domain-containing protein n=1 Tax=Paenibacillus senegalensis TaxID=1465766 RepID=UPI00028A3EE5|nr:helix-turn-helix transcriptional regulator [Paenibacillus senegalensis]